MGGDITFSPCGKKWLYLAVVIDLCSRRIVGWALADHLRSDLVIEAMKQAIASRRHTTDLIFHSDRGSQYGSRAFRDVLRLAGMRQSMSARANPYHNAWTESFMGTLKAEMLQNGRFINASDARTEIFAFIDGYYNTQRLRTSLNYRPPTTSRTKSPSQTKSLVVQISVASQTPINCDGMNLLATCRTLDLGHRSISAASAVLFLACSSGLPLEAASI